jgi:hypothetical protein
MSWKLATKVPKGIFFGCAGNPIWIGETYFTCNCANTTEKHLKNYKKYLFHLENYKKYEIIGKACQDKKLKGFYEFTPNKNIVYPDELK